MDAAEAKAEISYDQTTITPAENRVFKTVKDEPAEWLVDDNEVDPVHLARTGYLHRRRLREPRHHDASRDG